MMDLVLSVTVLSAIVLVAGALYLWRKRGQNRQAMLMAILAFVMIANVAVWLIPGADSPPAQEDATPQ